MVKRAYRYRFYPTDEQAKNLAQTFGCTRYVYNWALHRRKRAYFDSRVKLSTKDLSAALTSLLLSNEQLSIMGAAGANYARECLTWDRITRSFEHMYRDVADRSCEVARRPRTALA